MKMRKMIYADKFFTGEKVYGKGYLIIEDGKFLKFTKVKPNEPAELIDYNGKWIAPGLVDTHIHGFKNHDIMNNDPEGLKEISEGLLSSGVTSFLPTTLTSSIENLNDVVAMIGENIHEVDGAKIKGIFLEGPFFTEEHKGAQNPGYFLDPSIDILKKWQDLSQHTIKKIALAPERQGAGELIDYAVDEGITVSLAHSDATFNQAKEAVDRGASVFVHTYNGMSGLHHREPGMVGAALSLEDVFVELICDGYHVHPAAAKVAMDARGRDQVVLITDCMEAGGMPDGNYKLGEFPVTVKEGSARLESGNLAGSILELKDAVKNIVEWGIADPEDALTMASYTAAQSVGIENESGLIKEDRAADFIVLTTDLDLEATYLDGVCRYEV